LPYILQWITDLKTMDRKKYYWWFYRWQLTLDFFCNVRRHPVHLPGPHSGLLQIYGHLMNNQHFLRANSCNTINHVLVDCFKSGLKLINTYDRLFSLMCWFFQSGAPKIRIRKH